MFLSSANIQPGRKGRTSSQFLIGKRYNFLETKDDNVRRVHRVDAIRKELSILPYEILGFGTIDVPGTDEGTDVSEGTILVLTIQ